MYTSKNIFNGIKTIFKKDILSFFGACIIVLFAILSLVVGIATIYMYKTNEAILTGSKLFIGLIVAVLFVLAIAFISIAVSGVKSEVEYLNSTKGNP